MREARTSLRVDHYPSDVGLNAQILRQRGLHPGQRIDGGDEKLGIAALGDPL